MNNRPVEQALATLLPTHAQDLPPDLLSLAISLVAQSRSLSSSLKPDEEIARPYACAEIACRRLSRTLKLPSLLGHPPCPPRTYKKLYAFLDRSLSGGAPSSAPGTPSRTRTPTKTSHLTQTPSKLPPTTGAGGLQNTPTKSTPLKRTFAADTTPTTKTTPRHKPHPPQPAKNDHHLTTTKIPDAPNWTMSSIRTVCKTLSTPAPRMSTWSRPPISRTLPPHIFAGVSSILFFVAETTRSAGKHGEELDDEMLEFLEPVLTSASAGGEEAEEDLKELISALIVAVYFLVLARRRQVADSDSHGDGDGHRNKDGGAGAADAQIMDKKTFTEMRQTALVSLGLPATERRHREDVDQWIALIMEQGWAQGREWFENIPQAGEVDGDEEFLSDYGGGAEEEDGLTAGGQPSRKKQRLHIGKETRRGLLPGLGTMMQDRVDWLSEDRREEFAVWRAAIMKRVEQLEGKAGLA
ncbi:uncharacterized protein BP01DRAFT_347181 [Aspergillus saccharolyticus JOP 1030-1]|uniref:ORC6 first cyclin-like domain-containing protein n=1 Tax=Aspergillus saccharolyticus JOP 1030-1 TaxID=1450539 RepID=A0A318Z4T6_9EURO|nr:hypothetical protein BP01DRAFT_347181 [Aspergillus saccharolyticus JOP 1030-1]PYH42331.1 hypothetical protein BP01DRAFT_347181 [Aspergillus saccharolyticus JOP 1030-1]